MYFRRADNRQAHSFLSFNRRGGEKERNSAGERRKKKKEEGESFSFVIEKQKVKTESEKCPIGPLFS